MRSRLMFLALLISVSFSAWATASGGRDCLIEIAQNSPVTVSDAQPVDYPAENLKEQQRLGSLTYDLVVSTDRLGWITAIAVLAQTILLLLSFWTSREAAKAAMEAAKAGMKQASTAANALVMEQRPWLSVECEIASPFSYNEQGEGRVTFKFVVTNHGKTPAVNVNISAQFRAFFGDPLSLYEEIASAERLRPPQPGNLGSVLFPGQTVEFRQNMPIMLDEFRTFMKEKFGEENVTGFPACLVGCVSYKFTFEEGHHQTGFIIDVRQYCPETPNAAIGFNVNEPVSMDKLRLFYGFLSIPPRLTVGLR